MTGHLRWTAIGIFLLAFALRGVGIGYGLPYIYHQDEPVMVNHAMALGSGDLNTHFFAIPPFVHYSLFALYGTFFVIGRVVGWFPSVGAFAASYIEDPTPFYLLGRLFEGVLFGVGTVILVFFIGRKYFSERTALAAALFLAVSPLHVQLSHYIYADIPLLFAVTLLFGALFRLIEKPTLRSYLCAGAVFGWGMGIKYTMAYFLPVPILAHALTGKDVWVRPASWKKGLLACLAALAAFFVTAPFIFLDWNSFWAGIHHQASTEHPQGLFHHFFYSLAGGTSPLFLVLAAGGAVVLWRTHNKQALIMTVGAVFYYAVNVFFSLPFARYIMPVLPVLAWFAGAGWQDLSARLPARLRAVCMAVVLLSLFVPSAYFDYLHLQEDTRTMALHWVEQNIPAGSVVVLDNRFYTPRLLQTPEQLRAKIAPDSGPLEKWKLGLEEGAAQKSKTYNVYLFRRPSEGVPEFNDEKPCIDYSWDELRRVKAQYLVFNDLRAAGHLLLAADKGTKIEKIAFFTPYRDPAARSSLDPDASTAAPHLARELYRRARLGPYLEIYRIEERG